MRPYRYDIVGSFLRPDYLKDARTEYAEGTLSADQLREVEDKAIKELVEKEKAAGLKAVTDGELRRRYWHLDFLASLVGVEEIKADHWSVAFKGHQPKAATLEIVDKVDFDENSEFLDHFSYLKEVAGDIDCKMTIPSPTMLHLISVFVEVNLISQSIVTKMKMICIMRLLLLIRKRSKHSTLVDAVIYSLMIHLGENSVTRANVMIMQAVGLILTRLQKIM